MLITKPGNESDNQQNLNYAIMYTVKFQLHVAVCLKIFVHSIDYDVQVEWNSIYLFISFSKHILHMNQFK